MADTSAVLAHGWTELLHPRDAHGRFLNKGENVKLPDGSVGTVVGARAGTEGPKVLVHRGDGSVVSVDSDKTSITAQAPGPPSAPVGAAPDLHTQRDLLVGQAMEERNAFDAALTPTKESAAYRQMLATEHQIDELDHQLAVTGGDPLPMLPHEYDPAATALAFDAMASNPNFFQGDGWTINCANVVNAYELRRRGYRVSAQRLPDNLQGRAVQEVLNTWVDPTNQHRAMTLTRTANVENIVSGWPPGARGWVAVNWKTGGGHVFNVEKTADGKVRWVDAQTNTIMDVTTIDSYWNRATGLAKVTRVDDLTPTPDVLAYVQPVSDLPTPTMGADE